jgi:hypothetical protein
MATSKKGNWKLNGKPKENEVETACLNTATMSLGVSKSGGGRWRKTARSRLEALMASF